MINTITSASGATWRLLPVEKSLYHMYGENGEYNLKFVSDDGKYEGVYDKNGTELTEVNDPINMGTYNYADPVNNPIEHIFFDVRPYDYRLFGWGNTRDSVEGCKKACDAATDGTAKDKFKYNNEAVAYRNQIEVIIQ